MPGRSESTICRGLKRNRDKNGEYWTDKAHMLAEERCKRVLPSKFTFTAKNIIEDELQIHTTPEQISSILKNEGIYISHELIYQYINNDRKSGGTLYKLLTRRGNKYKKRNIKNSRRI